MKSFALVTFAGALCLAATYHLTRAGSFILAMVIIAIIGASAGVASALLNGVKTKTRLLLLALAFVIGTLFSEVISFVYYYFTYGYQDRKLNVGIAVSELEFGIIAVLGTIAMLIAASLTSRITRRSSGPPAAASEL